MRDRISRAVDLLDGEGRWLRTCPRGALEALDAVHREHASVAGIKLAGDVITVTYGRREYAYRVARATGGEINMADEGGTCHYCGGTLIRIPAQVTDKHGTTHHGSKVICSRCGR